MKQAVLAVLVLAAGFGGYRLYLSFATAEERMTRALETAVDDFNAARLRAMRVFDPKLRHENSSITYGHLQNALRYAFFNKTHSRTKAFLWRVRLREGTLQFSAVDEEAGTADCSFELELGEISGEEFRELWGIRIEANWLRDAEEGWRIRKFRHETVSGKQPRG